MRYFTAEELKNRQKEGATKILSSLAGKNVRYGLALGVFKETAARQSLSKEAAILDLGVASGVFTRQLFEAGYRNLYGTDLDNYLPGESRQILKEFRAADLSKDRLPWPDNVFDAATAWCILPHLENPFHCGREVARVLKPGGIFIFTALHLTSKPSMDFFLKHKYFGSYRESNNHIAFLPPEIVKKTFGHAFELIGLDYLIIPKIFRGWRGKIRKLLLNFAERYPRLKNYLKERWGYNVVYVLRKKDLGQLQS